MCKTLKLMMDFAAETNTSQPGIFATSILNIEDEIDLNNIVAHLNKISL